jgi:hypothetical protein
MPRLGSAIASTIVSLFSAVSFVGVDKAQAAVLTYDFDAPGEASGFFKVDTSLLTGIGNEGYEQIPVIEGRLDTFFKLIYGGEEGKKYYNLVGYTALFYQGEFGGLNAFGSDVVRDKYIYVVDEPYGSFSFYYSGSVTWSIFTGRRSSDDMWESFFSGYKEGYVTNNPNTGPWDRIEKSYAFAHVNYTLVNTETVPEPLTAGGTALALAGLSWLKHKKKMAA